jgi:hypothetical protein
MATATMQNFTMSLILPLDTPVSPAPEALHPEFYYTACRGAVTGSAQ